jgi:hypothetical protein
MRPDLFWLYFWHKNWFLYLNFNNYTMKIKQLVAGIFLVFTSFSFSQINHQGSVVVDPYYGFPNFGASFAKSVVSEVNDIKVTGIGPCGVRAEYFLADKFGIGIDFIYNSFNITGSQDSLNADQTVYKSYDYKASAQRYRAQLRMNYHFASTENLDAYFGFGVGTNNRRYVAKSDNPNFKDDSQTATLMPVSARIALGLRYYFNNNIGLNTEIGIGGPAISAGISFRFH